MDDLGYDPLVFVGDFYIFPMWLQVARTWSLSMNDSWLMDRKQMLKSWSAKERCKTWHIHLAGGDRNILFPIPSGND